MRDHCFINQKVVPGDRLSSVHASVGALIFAAYPIFFKKCITTSSKISMVQLSLPHNNWLVSSLSDVSSHDTPDVSQ